MAQKWLILQKIQNKGEEFLVIPTTCITQNADGSISLTPPGTVPTGWISTAELADAAVTNAKMANLARGSIKVWGAANAVTDLDAKASGKILVWDWTDLKSVAVSWDATLVANGALTVAANAITLSKLNLEVKTVQITGATSGTATVVAGGQILGWYVTAITWAERVKTVDISSTTLTVTLTGSDTATVMVVVLKA